MKINKAKDCPFCSDRGEVLPVLHGDVDILTNPLSEDIAGYVACCKWCDITTPVLDTPEECLKKWNTRIEVV